MAAADRFNKKAAKQKKKKIVVEPNKNYIQSY
jgi:hypothetical protein